MVDGHVRNFSGHVERLIATVPSATQFREPIREKLRATTGSVVASISVEDHNYNVEIRPTRELPTQVTMDVHGHRDERTRPTVKGRDAAWQARTSAMSRREGADEGLLIDELGNVISAVDASLLVLKGELVFHSTHPRTLLSVLEAPILEYLGKQGATPKASPEGFNIDELRSSEVWLIDSLSGIRRVNAWLEYGSAIPVSEVRPVAAFVPTFSEVNDYLWSQSENI